jgi:hypothetical protein
VPEKLGLIGWWQPYPSALQSRERPHLYERHPLEEYKATERSQTLGEKSRSGERSRIFL